MAWPLWKLSRALIASFKSLWRMLQALCSWKATVVIRLLTWRKFLSDWNKDYTTAQKWNSKYLWRGRYRVRERVTYFHTERWQHIERFTGAPKPVNRYVLEGSFRAHCDVAHVCSLEGKLIKTQCVGKLAELCVKKKERTNQRQTPWAGFVLIKDSH